MQKAFILLFFVSAAFGASAPGPGNWPQWRGPLATGEAPGANPPETWSETDHVKWKVKLPGSGTATPIIWDKQVFIHTAIKTAEEKKQEAPPSAAANENPGGRRRGGGPPRSEKPTVPYQFVLLSLDRDNGKVRWQKIVKEEMPHEGHHADHGFASFSPITDGERVYSYFGSRGLHCYDLEGNLKWEKDFGRMQTKNNFGEGSSPALHGNTLVINWDHEGEDFIVALDKTSGKELWRTPREEDTSWATPLIVEHAGKSQVVTSATRKIRSYDLTNGKLLWECSGMTRNAIPTPVPGDGVVYATSGFGGSAMFAIKLDSSGDISGSPAIAWSRNKSTPYVPSPLLYQNRLYFYSVNNGVLSAADAKTGETLIDAERIEGLSGVYASPVAANGKVYLVGRTGTTIVLKAGPKLEVLASNKLDERFDASPAIAGNQLFLRGHEYLYCLSE